MKSQLELIFFDTNSKKDMMLKWWENEMWLFYKNNIHSNWVSWRKVDKRDIVRLEHMLICNLYTLEYNILKKILGES